MLKELFFIFILKLSTSIAAEFSAKFCADVEPQSQVNIQHLTGMWYGIEIISHMKNEDEIVAKKRTATACPVVRISEEPTPSTISPLYEDYNYNSHYGTGYGYSDYNRGTQKPITEEELYHRVRLGRITESERRYLKHVKKMKILWDENGVMTEYTIRYNISQPGVWIASGPKNGSLLEEKFNYFAGTIQVLKVVGNHMVLTFCHRMPNPQLFTVLLSRSLPLNQADINGVHSQLDRRGLEMVSVTKVCSSANSINALLILVLFSLFFNVFKKKLV